MKNYLKYLIVAILLIILTIIIWLIFNNDNNSKKEPSIEGVSLSVKEGTLSNTGATFILKNDGNIDMIYGDSYTIEVKKDGEWQELKTDMQFNDPAYNLKSRKSKEIEINWEYEYGKLDFGKYRLIKKISYEKEKDRYGSFYVNVEFTLYDD